ncbi:hypothetical protein FRC04_011787 [Tulasnella sp. 424]|nr:hypothetical protein FRC04_011787 [Tulasnella sp. 424]
MPVVNVYVVRHGETVENANGIIQGQLDTQLNELGRMQAGRLGDVLSGTAQAIVDEQPEGDLQLVPDPGLRERYLGDMEGKHGSLMRRGGVPANAESGPALVARCLAWWDSTIVAIARSEDIPSPVNVLAVSHGAWIGTMIRSGLASRNYRGRDKFGGPLFNSSVSLVRVDEGGRTGEIVTYGDISHLLLVKKDGRWVKPDANNADVLSNEDDEERRAGFEVYWTDIEHILSDASPPYQLPIHSRHIMVVLNVYLVRHGETDANRQGIVQGQLETTLNATGREQARRLALALKDVEFLHAFVSNHTRAIETAAAVMKELPTLKWTVHPGLRERFFGDLQGKKRTNGIYPPSAEPLDKFVERALQWWDQELLGHDIVQHQFDAKRDETRNVLVIGHSAYLNNLIRALGSQRGFDITAAGKVKSINTGITILEVGDRHGTRGKIVQFSDVRHLQEMEEEVVKVNVEDGDKKARRMEG